MSTTTTRMDLYAELGKRLGRETAAPAIDVLAAWLAQAAATADEIAAEGCYPACQEDHAAHAGHFRHVELVLRNTYEAKPLADQAEAVDGGDAR